MSSLILGAVAFNVDELPEEINFGGEQVLAIRKFPGGGMDIQPMGSFDDQVSWNGILMYTGALDRANQLETYKNQANPLQLAVSKIKRTVLINTFKYRYVNDFYIPYEITVQPIINCTINGNQIHSSSTSSSTQNNASNSVSNNSVVASNKNAVNTYIVKANDSLWKIAVHKYNDGSKWPLIAQANKLKNPSSISPGLKLTIPLINS